MKQPVRAFSVGLFTAGIILLAVVLIFEKPNGNENTMSQQDMIASLEEDGMQVLSEEEYISLSVNDDSKSKSEEKSSTETNKEEESTKEEDNTQEQQEQEVKTFTLTIEPGLASSSISTILEENGIIDSASEFNQYLEENNYSQYVQIGEFELNTDMTYNEVAETITN